MQGRGQCWRGGMAAADPRPPACHPWACVALVPGPPTTEPRIQQLREITALEGETEVS